MNLKTVKEILNDGNSPKLPLVFVCKDSKFIANQYVSKIADIKGKEVIYCDSIDDVPYNKSFYVESDYIYVVVTDDFNCDNSISVYTNTIVICKNTDADKSITVEVPKLEKWMIEDYIKVYLKGIDKCYIDFILGVTNFDIYRIQSIIDKFSVFDTAEQQSAFIKACDEGEFSDIVTYKGYDLSNAIVKRDYKKVVDILSDSSSAVTTDFGLVALLYRDFKNVFCVQTSNKSAAEIGLSDAQYSAIKKYNCGRYTKDELLNILSFLSSFDYELKSGNLMNIDTLNYIIICVLRAGGFHENICRR